MTLDKIRRLAQQLDGRYNYNGAKVALNWLLIRVQMMVVMLK